MFRQLEALFSTWTFPLPSSLCSDKLAVVRVDDWPQSGEGARHQDMKCDAGIFHSRSLWNVHTLPPPAVPIANYCYVKLKWLEMSTPFLIYEETMPSWNQNKTARRLAEQQAPCLISFLQTWHTLPAFNVAVRRNPMSASSPPSLPRAFLHSLHPHHPSLPSTPSPSPSPPGPLYTRLSNGSHSIPSPTNSRGSFSGVSFLLQIGLTRETVNLEASDLSLSAVKDLVCSIVDQKVSNLRLFFF